MVNLKKNALKRKSTKSNTGKTKKDSKKKEKKKKEVKKKAKKVEDESEEEESSSDEEGCENNRTVAMNPTNIPQSLRVPEKKVLQKRKSNCTATESELVYEENTGGGAA
ncbi:unnamed protein product [Nippostrongylus brasiliensis]|uniref:Uncharacterized protein n=1 Tax=Nippostrongylus brasiliensis TaxID=27835 RepID=A0A0N4YHB0_NIPBR|nr:unnamed protein product [Nippostrongylus brasiliensis]